jgi:hypothetical protein
MNQTDLNLLEPIPRYRVTKLPLAPGVANAVRVEVLDTHPAFMDEAEPMEMRADAATQDALADYLAALSEGRAWVRREARGTADWEMRDVAGRPQALVTLSAASSSKRPISDWYMVLQHDAAGGADDLLELCTREQALARRLFEAVAHGGLVVDAVKAALAPGAKRGRQPRP